MIAQLCYSECAANIGNSVGVMILQKKDSKRAWLYLKKAPNHMLISVRCRLTGVLSGFYSLILFRS